jgi:hypothetical protein
MEHRTIAALVLAEHNADPHDHLRQRRFDAMRGRDRRSAAQARVILWARVRAGTARRIRRLAEVIEPPRPVCVAASADPC